MAVSIFILKSVHSPVKRINQFFAKGYSLDGNIICGTFDLSFVYGNTIKENRFHSILTPRLDCSRPLLKVEFLLGKLF